MPADTETSHTFEQLIVALAEDVGMARYNGTDGAASLPTDAARLAKLKRAVNDGYAMFLRGDPNWSFMWYEHTIATNGDGLGASNVNSDAARYRMPAFISGNPTSNLVYLDNSAVFPFCAIQTKQYVEQQHQAVASTGAPSMVCFRPIQESGRSTGWEAFFYPTPDGVYSLKGEWRVHPYKLVDPSERHVAGADHDVAIKKAIRYAWALEDEENGADVRRHFDAWEVELKASKKIDIAKRPAKRGTLTQSNPVKHNRAPSGALVTHINGMPIPQ